MPKASSSLSFSAMVSSLNQLACNSRLILDAAVAQEHLGSRADQQRGLLAGLLEIGWLIGISLLVNFGDAEFLRQLLACLFFQVNDGLLLSVRIADQRSQDLIPEQRRLRVFAQR